MRGIKLNNAFDILGSLMKPSTPLTADDVIMENYGFDAKSRAAIKKNPDYRPGLLVSDVAGNVALKHSKASTDQYEIDPKIPIIGGIDMSNVFSGMVDVGLELGHALSYAHSLMTGDQTHEQLFNIRARIARQGLDAAYKAVNDDAHNASLFGLPLGNKSKLIGQVAAMAPLTLVGAGQGILGAMKVGAISGALTPSGNYDPNDPAGYAKDVLGRIVTGTVLSGVLHQTVGGVSSAVNKGVGKAINAVAGNALEKPNSTMGQVVAKILPGFTADNTYIGTGISGTPANAVISNYRNMVRDLHSIGSLDPNVNANALTLADVTGNPSSVAVQGIMTKLNSQFIGLRDNLHNQNATVKAYIQDYIGGKLKTAIDNTQFVGEDNIRTEALSGNVVAQNILNSIDNSKGNYAEVLKASLQAKQFVNKDESTKLFDTVRSLMEPDIRPVSLSKTGLVLNEIKNGPGFTVSTSPYSSAARSVIESLSNDLKGTLPTYDTVTNPGQPIGPVGFVSRPLSAPTTVIKAVEPEKPLMYSQVSAMRKALQNDIDAAYHGNPTGIGENDIPILRRAIVALDEDLGTHVKTSGIKGPNGEDPTILLQEAKDNYRINVAPYQKLGRMLSPTAPADEVASKILRKGALEDYTAGNLELLDQKGRLALQNHIIDTGLAKAMEGDKLNMKVFLTHMKSFSGATNTVFPDITQQELNGASNVMAHLVASGSDSQVPYRSLTNPKTWPLVAALPIVKWMFTNPGAKRFLLSASTLNKNPGTIDNLIKTAMKSIITTVPTVGYTTERTNQSMQP